MPTPRAVEEHYRSQQRLTVATLGLTRRAWSRMGEDFDSSWRAVRPLLVVVVARAQLGAATAGAGYVGPTLEELGTPVEPVAEVVPRAFAGVASDGRPLTGLLDGAVVTAKDAVASGAAAREALAIGGRWLDMVVHTQVADAARGAAGVAIAVRSDVGYVRMLNPPSCSRCTILAGRRFYKNPGFDRHPRCDCEHVPCTEDVAGDLVFDPKAYFDSLPMAADLNERYPDLTVKARRGQGIVSQEDVFTKSGAQAIRDGADLGRVVNARRGMAPSYERLDRIYASDRPHEQVVRALQKSGFVR